MMKKLSGLIFLPSLVFLAACGDEVTQINQTGLEVVGSAADLPECTSKNKGEQVLVTDEAIIRVCVDGEWFATKSGAADDLSCTTEELKDGSGLKIICNGDSIGVVLNGEKGDSGKDGKDGKDGEDAVLQNDTLANDSERVAVSLDSLAGFSQKGPFLKGSTVYLYELSDGRTLKQTNGNFTSYITRDDGRYKFSARDLASQYAMIVVEGNYRNEVTGGTSDAPIRLRALTDMRKRSDANINLLTTLEFDRVYHLVTRGDEDGKKLTVKQAKKKAQAEIFKAFDIDTTGFKGSAEDLDVFGASDADAALLAISIMLQGDGNATDLSVLLTEIANDMETDGKWDDSVSKAKVLDWISMADGKGRLGDFRKYVGGWGLSDTVPVFEKFVRNFYSVENKLGKCGGKNIAVGTVKGVGNPASKYYAATYSDTSKTKVRFICADADSARWREATDIEKDTSGLGHDFKEGEVLMGNINRGLKYVYQDGNWRHGTELDWVVGTGCLPNRDNKVQKGRRGDWYKCIGDSAMKYLNDDGVEEASWFGAWREASDIEKDTNGLGSEGYSEGDTAWGRVNNKKIYGFENGYWVLTSAAANGKGCVKGLAGMVALDVEGKWVVCSINEFQSAIDGSIIVTRFWMPASDLAKDTMWTDVPAGGWENNTVRNGLVNSKLTYVYQDGWRHGTALDSILVEKGGTACINEGDTSSVKHDGVYYVCTHQTTIDTIRKWVVAPDIYNKTFELRDSCAAGKMYDGMAITSVPDAWGTRYYVCDAGKFKEVQSSELKSSKFKYRACVSYNQDHIYKYDGYYYKCQASGWITVDDGAKGKLWDGQREYKTAIIGTQHWMAENLNRETENSYCYNNEDSKCEQYGRLYTWEAAKTVCPTGWHLPSQTDWKTLKDWADVEAVFTGRGGLRLKSESGWANSGNGNDALGFSAFPGGYRYVNTGSAEIGYLHFGDEAHFWSTSEYGSGSAYSMDLYYDENEIFFDFFGKTRAYSVRCLQDSN